MIADFLEDFLEGLPELLRSPRPIPPDVLAGILREVLRDVIGVLRLRHVNLHPIPKHRPKGKWGRWRDANHVAAAVAEGRIIAWKAKAGEQRISNTATVAGDIEMIEIPADKRNPIIKWAVDLVNGWHIARRKKASVRRVTVLLDGARSRRLPPLTVIA